MSTTAILANAPDAQADIDQLNLTRCPAVPTASALAYQLGYLQEEFANERGLATTFKSIGFTGKLEYAHRERFWIRNAGHAPAVWARAQGVDTRVVALAWLEGSYPLVVLKSSGIAQAADLKGKRLGVIGRVGQSFDLMIAQQLKIYTTALGTAGLTLDDAVRVNIAAPEFNTEVDANGLRADHFVELGRALTASLVKGEVDVVITRLPSGVAEFVGLRTIYDTHDHPDPVARVHPSVLRGLVVSTPLLTERRDIVVRYLARLLQATHWAREHRDETIALIARDFRLAPNALAQAYDDVSAGVQIDLDATKIDSLRAQKDFLLKHGFIAHDFDVDAWVDSTPLAEAHVLFAQWRAQGKV